MLSLISSYNIIVVFNSVGNFPAFGKTKVETLGQQKEEVLRYGSNSDIEFEHDALKKRDRTSHKREEITKET